MIIQRQFSIQSGGPDGGAGSLKKELTNRIKVGAIAGGVTGAIGGTITGISTRNNNWGGFKFGAKVAVGTTIAGAIYGALTALGANHRRAEAENATMNSLLDYLYGQISEWDRKGLRGDLKRSVKVDRYLIEDGDPNKFMVNFAYEDGKLVINLNKPSNAVIETLNDDLEEMVKFNRKADYASNPINNGFMIYAVCPSLDFAAEIIYNIIEEHHLKVNALTEKSLK